PARSSRVICNLQSAIRNPQSAIRNPQSAICNTQSPQSIRNPQSAISNQSAIRNPQSAMSSAFQYHACPMNPEEFRAAGHRLIDWIADYRTRVDGLPVMARTEP